MHVGARKQVKQGDAASLCKNTILDSICALIFSLGVLTLFIREHPCACQPASRGRLSHAVACNKKWRTSISQPQLVQVKFTNHLRRSRRQSLSLQVWYDPPLLQPSSSVNLVLLSARSWESGRARVRGAVYVGFPLQVCIEDRDEREYGSTNWTVHNKVRNVQNGSVT